MLYKPFALLRLYALSRAASRYAAARGAPGLEFYHYGSQLGRRLLGKGSRAGIRYMLAPVSIVRYFEFPFALSCLPECPGHFLDVSSPKLFSLYVAEKGLTRSILMINPDPGDASETAAMTSRLRINNVRVQRHGVDMLANQRDTYDCIWSISVIEHIAGEYDDSYAIKLMYDSLKDGGRLILTVPVDREFLVEYRDQDYYGTQPSQTGGENFFQRVYDKAAIWKRLLSPIEKEPSVVRWFGETTPGRYREYEKRWVSEGLSHTIEDPREIADYYQEFSSWEEMPGMGVCGLMIQKEKSAQLTKKSNQ